MKQILDTPNPTWKNILSIFYKYPPKDIDITKRWFGESSQAFIFSRSAWSLFYVATFRKKLYGNTRINFWLPDYFCNSALLFLKKQNINFNFYPLKDDLSPDYEQIKVMLRESDYPDIFLATNYFGKKIEFLKLFEIFKKTNTWLIEDCAHMLDTREASKYFHFNIFSPHKFLPIPDVSFLQVNTENFSYVSSNSIHEHFYIYKRSNLFNNFLAFKWVLKKILLKLGYRKKILNLNFASDPEILTSMKLIRPYASFIGKILIYDLHKELQFEKEIRKKNYLVWKRYLNNSELVEYSDKDTPYLYSMKYESERFIRDLNRIGIPVYSWPDLPQKIKNDKTNRHEKAKEMRAQYQFLPLHRSISPEIIKSCLKQRHN